MVRKRYSEIKKYSNFPFKVPLKDRGCVCAYKIFAVLNFSNFCHDLPKMQSLNAGSL